jgi:hypothetical protein
MDREGHRRELDDLASTSRYSKPVVDLDSNYDSENSVDLNQDWDSFVQIYMMSYPENIDDLVKYREYKQRISAEDQSWSPANSANMKIFAIVTILKALPVDFELMSLKDLVRERGIGGRVQSGKRKGKSRGRACAFIQEFVCHFQRFVAWSSNRLSSPISRPPVC